MAKESLHWADQIAREVKERVENDDILKKVVKNGYIVYDEKTPSGKIHIGSGRGWIIHDAIAKAMRGIGLRARFVLSSDDLDPFDKMNADLPEEYEKYLGLPFRNIPSPVEGYKSFADYYFSECVEKFEEYGIEADIESTGDRYINGDFNKAIKKILDNADKVNAIYERFYGSHPDKLPFNPICEKCGKIGTTKAYEWDKEREVLKYKCEETLVEWARGCGHEGEISPYNGNGKFPWKVEWAAKWPTVGAIVEFAGKDHFTKGGSRSIAVAIADEILDFPPPYPSTRKATGKGYEFFTIGGRKMSTSKGKGIGFVEATKYAPAKILRYLLIATRPNAVIDFDPVNKNDLILLYDRFDKTERIYYGIDKVANEQEASKHKRVYELAHVGKIPEKMMPQVSFSLCGIIIQVALDVDKAIRLLQKMKHLPDKMSEDETNHVKERLKFAETWVNNFAPEQFRFKVQDKVDIKIAESHKGLVKHFIDYLKKNEIDEEALYEEFYNASRKHGIEPKDFFKTAYLILIGKEKGPRLAAFMASLGKEKIISLFEQAVQ